MSAAPPRTRSSGTTRPSPQRRRRPSPCRRRSSRPRAACCSVHRRVNGRCPPVRSSSSCAGRTRRSTGRRCRSCPCCRCSSRRRSVIAAAGSEDEGDVGGPRRVRVLEEEGPGRRVVDADRVDAVAVPVAGDRPEVRADRRRRRTPARPPDRPSSSCVRKKAARRRVVDADRVVAVAVPVALDRDQRRGRHAIDEGATSAGPAEFELRRNHAPVADT